MRTQILTAGFWCWQEGSVGKGTPKLLNKQIKYDEKSNRAGGLLVSEVSRPFCRTGFPQIGTQRGPPL